MEIYPLGHASFRIKGKGATVVTDPYLKSVGADIVTVSHGHFDHSEISKISGDPFVISGPGEYEVKGITVVGIPSYHDDQNGAQRGNNVIYKMVVDEVRICHLGDLGHKLTDEQLEAIGDVDILLVPVGGFYTIDPEVASQVVAQIEPLVVIPMHYFKEGLDKGKFGKLATVDVFLKQMGVETLVPQPKFATTKDKLPETTTVICLQ